MDIPSENDNCEMEKRNRWGCVMRFNNEGRDWMIFTFLMGKYLRESIEDA